MVPISEFDLLQSCQKIIDAAQSMKCISCQQIFQTTDFYDHIIVKQECVIESDIEYNNDVFEYQEGCGRSDPSMAFQLADAQYSKILRDNDLSQGGFQRIIEDLSAENENRMLRTDIPQSISDKNKSLEFQLDQFVRQTSENRPLQNMIPKQQNTVKGNKRMSQTCQEDQNSSSQPNGSENVSKQLEKVYQTQQSVKVASNLINREEVLADQYSADNRRGFYPSQLNHLSPVRLAYLNLHSNPSNPNNPQTQNPSKTKRSVVSGSANQRGTQGYAGPLTGTLNSNLVMSLSRSNCSLNSSLRNQEREIQGEMSMALQEDEKVQQFKQNDSLTKLVDNNTRLDFSDHKTPNDVQDTSQGFVKRFNQGMASAFNRQDLMASCTNSSINLGILVTKRSDCEDENNNRSREIGSKERIVKDDRSHMECTEIIRGIDQSLYDEQAQDLINRGEDEYINNFRTNTQVQVKELKSRFDLNQQDFPEDEGKDILSQSLRELVTSHQQSEGVDVSGIDNLINQVSVPLQLFPSDGSSKKKIKIKQKLENLYDLDTSRFEEECEKLGSSQKKLLLDHFEDDPKEETRPEQLVHSQHGRDSSQRKGSEQSQNFQDLAKFNHSMDQGKMEQQRNLGGRVKVVGINLVPSSKKQSQNDSRDQRFASKFEQSVVSNQQKQKPKFDLSKQINEINLKKMEREKRAKTNDAPSEKGDKKRSNSQMKRQTLKIEIPEDGVENIADEQRFVEGNLLPLSPRDVLKKQSDESVRNFKKRPVQTEEKPSQRHRSRLATGPHSNAVNPEQNFDSTHKIQSQSKQKEDPASKLRLFAQTSSSVRNQKEGSIPQPIKDPHSSSLKKSNSKSQKQKTVHHPMRRAEVEEFYTNLTDRHGGVTEQSWESRELDEQPSARIPLDPVSSSIEDTCYAEKKMPKVRVGGKSEEHQKIKILLNNHGNSSAVELPAVIKSTGRRLRLETSEMNVTDVHSPLSKKLNQDMKQQLGMRNVKAGNFESTTENLLHLYDQQYHQYLENQAFSPIIDNEADENIQDKSSEELLSPEQESNLQVEHRDTSNPYLVSERVNHEGMNGLLSQRHNLGQHNLGFKPTLMTHNQYQSVNQRNLVNQQSTVLQETRRYNFGGENKILEIKKQLLLDQIDGQETLMNQVRQQLMQGTKKSPVNKNSDYIRSSMLLSAKATNPRISSQIKEVSNQPTVKTPKEYGLSKETVEGDDGRSSKDGRVLLICSRQAPSINSTASHHFNSANQANPPSYQSVKNFQSQPDSIKKDPLKNSLFKNTNLTSRAQMRNMMGTTLATQTLSSCAGMATVRTELGKGLQTLNPTSKLKAGQFLSTTEIRGISEGVGESRNKQMGTGRSYK